VEAKLCNKGMRGRNQSRVHKEGLTVHGAGRNNLTHPYNTSETTVASRCGVT
jgi:hypothetical protein